MDHSTVIENPNNGSVDLSNCFDAQKAKDQPGDFQSDAQFFVFTGVIAWLGATGCLIIYVFFSQKYLDDDKKVPMIVSMILNISILYTSFTSMKSLNIKEKLTSPPRLHFRIFVLLSLWLCSGSQQVQLGLMVC